MSTPAQRSLALLRKEGWRCAVVERWNAFANIRQDLFGVVDILCLRDGETLAVQATSYSNVAARVRKIADAEATPDIRDAGWRFEVHGWRRVGHRFKCRRVDVS